jgi:3-oxoacyl-[acyl-carrier protein] reductase
MKLKDKAALVTGGGSGLGRAISLLFAREGARVIVNDINLDSAQKTVEAMGDAKPRGLAIGADVADSAQVRAMFEEIGKKVGRLDILVNNAGIAEPDARWDELNRLAEVRLEEIARGGRPETHWDVTVAMDDETWRQMIAVHLDGTFFCCREALKRMGPQGQGVIINLSSTAALAGLPDAPHYAAAKAGVLGFTRSLALEVASRGIRVNAIAPGLTETPMTSRIAGRLRVARTGSIPMGRWASPSEIAAVALFLASEDSSYVTGQCISPNGGSFPGP